MCSHYLAPVPTDISRFYGPPLRLGHVPVPSVAPGTCGQCSDWRCLTRPFQFLPLPRRKTPDVKSSVPFPALPSTQQQPVRVTIVWIGIV